MTPSADTPLPLWDVISFAASTEGASAFRFFAAGITGGFNGRYERLPFHEKGREYEVLDDRDLWLLELRLSEEQYSDLEDAISSHSGQEYPYTFFIRNCAYYLQLLLSQSDLGVTPPTGLTSPTDVWSRIADTELAGRSLFRPAASRRLNQRLDELDSTALERLRQEEWQSVVGDTMWIKSLTAEELRTFSDYVGWRALTQSEALPDAANRGMEALRRQLGSLVVRSDEAPADPLGTEVPRPHFHEYSRLTTSYTASPDGQRLGLLFRPAMHGDQDPWLAHRPVNTLEFLSLAVSGSLLTGDLRLESFVLFSQRSLTPRSWLARDKSWMLEARIERGGVSGDGLQGVVRSGIGGAASVGDRFFVHGLLVVGGSVSKDKALAFGGVDAGALFLISPSWRAGGNVQYEHPLTARREGYSTGTIWARWDFGQNVGLVLRYRQTNRGAEYGIGSDLYFR